MLLSLLLAFTIFVGIPTEPSSGRAYATAFFLLGLLGQWCGPGVNQPLLAQADMAVMVARMAAVAVVQLTGVTVVNVTVVNVTGVHGGNRNGSNGLSPVAQVVPPHMRATVMAAEWGLEASSASVLGGPLVGLLAQYAFGYTSSDLAVGEIAEPLRAANVRALRHALALTTLVPWSLCLLSYTLVGFTFAADRDRAKAANAKGGSLADKLQAGPGVTAESGGCAGLLCGC